MAVVRKIPVKIVEIQYFSENVRLYRLEALRPGISFKAGQFLHFSIDAYDPSYNWPESRVFSIANSPTRTQFIDILVSKIGEYTTKMFDNLKVGDEAWIKLPYGIFNFDDSLHKDTVLIAGGTGISPFISFLQYAIDIKLDTVIHLNYGVRNPDLLIIQDLVKEAENKLSNFNYSIHVEELDGNKSDLKFYTGQLPVNEIVSKSLKLNDPVFYLSGPPAMILAFDKELKANNIKQSNIKYDNWE
ncbi:MAG: FAD-dependent oxidoreductase [Bacteroidales bacterium]|nr:FAD-dependent oxidoreductase [Bacteroidales bacterium]MBN2757703.1 FAD-dependent oxidoreductase [Bacteroidales bacterium]